MAVVGEEVLKHHEGSVSRHPTSSGTGAGGGGEGNARSGPSSPVTLGSHGKLLLLGVAGITVLRYAGTGKFSRSWKALWGASSPKATAAQVLAADKAANPPHYGAPDRNGSNPQYSDSGGAGTGPFGLHDVTWTHPAPAHFVGLDKAAWPDTVGEMNYQLPNNAHEDVHLPGGSWKETAYQNTPGLGIVESFKNTSNKAVLRFIHLFTGRDAIGSTVPGGSIIGKSGWPTSSAYSAGATDGTNAHLAVAYNAQGEQYVGNNGGW